MAKPINTNRKIAKGNFVVVTTGKFKGTKATVLARHGDKLSLEGVTVSKSIKADPSRNIEGGYKQVPKLIDASNVMLFDAEANKVLKKKVAVAKSAPANVKDTVKPAESKEGTHD